MALDLPSYLLGKSKGGSSTLITKNISENGIYNASSDNADGYSKVTVNVPAPAPNLQNKQVTITTNTTTTIQKDSGYDGLGTVEVTTNIPQPSGNINITDTNVIDVTNYATAQVVDSDLVAGNIKKDINILGVVGTYEGSGGDVSEYFTDTISQGTSTIGGWQKMVKKIPTTTTVSSRILDYAFKGFQGTSVPLLDTSNVFSFVGMFQQCINLTTIPLFPIITSTGTSVSMNKMFSGCTSLTTIPLLNTSRVNDFTSIFEGCTSLTSVPQLDTSIATNLSNMFRDCTSLTSIPQLNTSNAYNLNSFCNGCTALTTVPLLNIPGAGAMTGMFRYCANLTDTSLDNILQMCISATSFTGTKTLVTLGFANTDYPASRIQALTHYQDFVNAGWTIGY